MRDSHPPSPHSSSARGPDEVAVDFAIAPNGKEESLKTYVSAVRRKAAAS
jgi:hypothetical protein